MAAMTMKPGVLLILDGWGYRRSRNGNAVALAHTPTWDYLMRAFPWTLLHSHGEWVGLSDEQMGNSEVGHLNIGAGRKVLQPLARIHRMIEEGSFFTHPALSSFLHETEAAGSRLHLMGLLSDGGVHSHIGHLMALIDAAEKMGVRQLAVHAMLDGRDTSPTAGRGFIGQLLPRLASYSGTAELASVSGRYYPMDRDQRWERTERGYRAIVQGQADEVSRDPLASLMQRYERGETDEFVQPFVVAGSSVAGARGAEPLAMQPQDRVLFFNFREDRARQLSWAFLRQDFKQFARPFILPVENFFSFSRYSDELDNRTLLTTEELSETVAEYLASQGLGVFKCAETEKYAHVTYFFNGGREEPFPGEERALIPSPKVATYDLKPEMSVFQVAEKSVQAIKSGKYFFVVINFANGDMVGHTGILEAAVEASEAVDKALAQILSATGEGKDAFLIVTADHGNCEEMLRSDGTVLTQHSLNPVPLVLIGGEGRTLGRAAPDPNHPPSDDDAEAFAGEQALRDIVPTFLDLWGMGKPSVMDGASLLK